VAVQLNPQQVAAAEWAGCRFRPASAAEAQRLAMQRRVFLIDGAPYLAVRSDGFCETAGTLEPLIAEGLKALHAAAPPPEPLVQAEPPPVPKLPRAPRKPRSPPPPAAPPTAPPAEPQPAVVPVIARAAAKPRPREREKDTPRWLTAGAERRGRAAQHWSGRGR